MRYNDQKLPNETQPMISSEYIAETIQEHKDTAELFLGQVKAIKESVSSKDSLLKEIVFNIITQAEQFLERKKIADENSIQNQIEVLKNVLQPHYLSETLDNILKTKILEPIEQLTNAGNLASSTAVLTTLIPLLKIMQEAIKNPESFKEEKIGQYYKYVQKLPEEIFAQLFHTFFLVFIKEQLNHKLSNEEPFKILGQKALEEAEKLKDRIPLYQLPRLNEILNQIRGWTIDKKSFTLDELSSLVRKANNLTDKANKKIGEKLAIACLIFGIVVFVGSLLALAVFAPALVPIIASILPQISTVISTWLVTKGLAVGVSTIVGEVAMVAGEVVGINLATALSAAPLIIGGLFSKSEKDKRKALGIELEKFSSLINNESNNQKVETTSSNEPNTPK